MPRPIAQRLVSANGSKQTYVSNGWWSQEVGATRYLERGEVMRWRRDDDGCSLRRRAPRFGIAGSGVKG
jgi:hypothetical protein